MLKPIPDFPDYFINKKAQIFSIKNRRAKHKRKKPIQIKTRQSWSGHHVASLHKNNRPITKNISSLMLTTFVSPRPKGMLACHGIKGSTVDTLDNLYWGTQVQNNKEDKLRDGTLSCGEKHYKATLNELQVRIIRRAYSFRGCGWGISGKELAQIFNTSVFVISQIVTFKTWNHINY